MITTRSRDAGAWRSEATKECAHCKVVFRPWDGEPRGKWLKRIGCTPQHGMLAAEAARRKAKMEAEGRQA